MNISIDTSLVSDEAEPLLAAIRELAPAINARVAEIEAGRRLPLDLVQKLRSIGVFRMLAPRSHGGLELDLPAAVEILTALARIDGSVGWCATITSGASIVAALLPPQTYEQIYRNGPDVILAGSATTPGGTAEAAPGGWRVNGRWPFASGCQHADWLAGLCVMKKGGEPLPGPAGEKGPPMVRCFVLPAGEWQIEDTWYVAGLKGSGSHHISVEDKFVPAGNFFDFAQGVSSLPGPLYRAPLSLLPLLLSAVAVGIAEGALHELVAQANTGWQQQRAATPARESELFQFGLGRTEADIRAARAFLQCQAERYWRDALGGTPRNDALSLQAVQVSQAAAWVNATSVRAVDACFALGGGTAIYASSPLQRRMRDLHVAAQHAAVQQRNFASAGKQLLENSLPQGAVQGR
jgi:alkylation response protein AidB-like acyl-CoA dehydrogenase